MSVFVNDRTWVTVYLKNCEKYRLTPNPDVIIYLQSCTPHCIIPSSASLLPLATVLCENANIVKLSIRKDVKCDWNANCVVLKDVLMLNKTLEEVELVGLRINAEGVAAIAAGLEKNVSVTHCDLARNSIGPLGAEILGKCLANRKPLKLNVSFNAIGFAASLSLRKLLPGETRTDGNYVVVEIYNAATHGVGLAFAVIASGVLMQTVWNSPRVRVWSCVVYCFGLMLVFSSSMLFHSFFRLRRARAILRILDHIAIFINIACTSTPLLLYTRRPSYDVVLVAIYALSSVGIGIHLASAHGREEDQEWFQKMETLCGVLAVSPWFFVCRQFAIDVPDYWLILLFGTLTVFAGVPFFQKDKQHPIFHTVWHIFVVVASITLWIGIWLMMLAVEDDKKMCDLVSISTK